MRAHSRILAVLLAAAGPASAVDVPITNPGFENIVGAQVTFNEFTFGSLPGWTVYDPNGVANGGVGNTYYAGTLTPQIIPARDPVNYQNFPAGAFQGQRVGIAFNYANAVEGNEYGLQQTLSVTLQAQTAYTLRVRIGNIASGYSVDGNFFNLAGFPGYRIDLLAGNTVLVSDHNTLAGTISEGQWGESVVNYQTGTTPAQLGQALRIRLVNLNVVDPSAPGAHREVDFDAVLLDAVAVPEPANAGLLIVAGLGAAALHRSLRARQS